METVIQELPLLLQGVAVTLQISVLVIVAGSIIGIFGGLGCSTVRFGSLAARGYVDIVRGLPLLMTIFIIFYIPPALDIEVSGFAAVTVALSIFAGAHISEIVRGAVAVGVTARTTPRKRSVSPSGPESGMSSCPRPCRRSSRPGRTRLSRWSRGARSPIWSASASCCFKRTKSWDVPARRCRCTSPLRSSTLPSTSRCRVLASCSSAGFATPHDMSVEGLPHD